MKKFFGIIIVVFSFVGTDVYSNSETNVWGEKACLDLYKSIGLFAHLADKEWKEKNEKKAAFYASVAANYATIFKTVCNGK